MNMQMRKVWLVAATLLCAWHASAGSAQAGPLLDWLTGWFRGYPYQPATSAYYPYYSAYPSQVGTYEPAIATQAYYPGSYPPQIQGASAFTQPTYPSNGYARQVAGYAPVNASLTNSSAWPRQAYSPVTTAYNVGSGCSTCSPTASYMPTTAYQPIAATTGCNTCPQQVACSPPVMGNICTQQTFRRQIVNYVPQTYYRTAYRRIPVTNYRPVTTADPVTGCPVTCMQPCVTYTYQAARVPIHVCRPIFSTVPAGPCSPCGGVQGLPMGGSPYYGTPTTGTPNAMTTPGVMPAPGMAPTTIPNAITVPQGGLQPADIRPSLTTPYTYGPTPDTGVGSRVNRIPTDSTYRVQPSLESSSSNGSNYVPPATSAFGPPTQVGSDYGSSYNYGQGAPSGEVRVQRQTTSEPNSSASDDSQDGSLNSPNNLRPIPRPKSEDEGIQVQPTFGAPDLLDPRDRTASIRSKAWDYSLISWPEPQTPASPRHNDSAAKPLDKASVSDVKPPATKSGELELTAPVVEPNPARRWDKFNWDDTGWRSY